ncbi:UNVERIFIED_CONTAM: Hydroxyproline O-arabinosyltransferase RDN1 [Sesamum radiatum]|uniref:Hydroxyproline O-arabinosyltransferase RDN1 n=1 Tax=Sesamum radiatum TaxID=300843 RepID=A0AAW2S709_SESRA
MLRCGNIIRSLITHHNSIDDQGELTYGKVGEWQFDKRTYLDGPPPRNLSLPPPGVPESVVTLINLINEATANLPNWDDVH